MMNQSGRRSACHGRAGWAWALVLLSVGACDESVGCAPVLTTQGGQLEFHDQAITVGACQRLRESAPLLVGAQWCPALRCGADVPGCENDDGDKLSDEAVAACFEPTLSGPVAQEEPCLRMTDAGEVTWSFRARPCAATDAGYEPADDQLRLTVVDVEPVQAHLESPGDAFALRSLVDDNGDALTDDAALSPGTTARIVADTEVHLAAVLVHPDHDQAVGWNPTEWRVDAQTLAGEPAQVELMDLGLVALTLSAGARTSLTLVPEAGAGVGRSIPLGEVIGVDPDELVTLQLVAAFAPPPDDSPLPHGPVAGARAVLRTEQGDAVYGAQVQWSVLAGALPVWRDEALPWGADYVALAERDGASCHEPPAGPQQYEATIGVEFGELSDQRLVVWTVVPEDAGLFGSLGDLFDEPPAQSPNCQGPGFASESGCSCATTTSTPPWAWVLVVGLAAVRFRRRKSRR